QLLLLAFEVDDPLEVLLGSVTNRVTGRDGVGAVLRRDGEVRGRSAPGLGGVLLAGLGWTVGEVRSGRLGAELVGSAAVRDARRGRFQQARELRVGFADLTDRRV